MEICEFREGFKVGDKVRVKYWSEVPEWLHDAPLVIGCEGEKAEVVQVINFSESHPLKDYGVDKGYALEFVDDGGESHVDEWYIVEELERID